MKPKHIDRPIVAEYIVGHKLLILHVLMLYKGDDQQVIAESGGFLDKNIVAPSPTGSAQTL